MAVVEKTRIYYVTSDHQEAPYLDKQDNLPLCTEIKPDWIKTTPWRHLSQMRVFQSGDFLVFIPHDMEEMHITTRRYWFLPQLHAIMVHSASSL